MSELYTVLSPWAETDNIEKLPLNPRLDTLEGKTIGLYASFKEYHPFFMQEVERQLAARYPTAKFSHYTYIVDTQEIDQDPENFPIFKKWLEGVDAVIGVGADMGSCALYMGYIFAQIERLGKPACLLSKYQYVPSASKGASARSFPGLRMVTYDGPGFVPNGVDCNEWTIQVYRGKIAEMLDGMVDALTRPLTEEEKHPVSPKDYARETFTGTLTELTDQFYRLGFTNGTPIIPPTEEAVAEMCRGTDLPRDHVVGRLPPRLGLATVEKIAINGVMAGCLPTYMPVLIALVKAMLDPRIQLEGYTCSRGSWGPVIILNGPIRHAVHINSGAGLLSPYDHASTTIARAMGLMVMNLSGVRPKLEDLCGMGHIGRFGTCIAENEEDSPWPPLQTDFGFGEDDSTVTLFWPSDTFYFRSRDAEKIPPEMCRGKDNGFDPGCGYILCPEFAKTLADAGWTKKKLLDYIVEYNRQPASQVPIRWLRGNHHVPENIPLPMDPGESCRSFWTQDHMFVMVGGEGLGAGLLGGGDHGGPSCAKIELPADWEALAAEYRDFVPHYVNY